MKRSKETSLHVTYIIIGVKKFLTVKGETVMRRKLMQGLSFCLLMCLITSMMVSCGENTDTIPDNAPAFLTLPYKAERVDIKLEENQYVLDADEENSGFKILIGTPEAVNLTEGILEDGTPYQINDMAEIYEPYTSIINSTVHHYASDFSKEVTPSEPALVRYARLFETFDGVEYTFRGVPATTIYSLQIEHTGRTNMTFRGNTYEMCIGESTAFAYYTDELQENYDVWDFESNQIVASGTVTYKVGDAAYDNGIVNPVGLRDCQYWVKDGVVFSVSMVAGYEGNFLFINDRMIEQPEAGGRIQNPRILGVAELKNTMYAILSYEEKEKGIGKSSVSVGVMVPIDENTTGLDLSIAKRLQITPTGMCGTDGEMLYFMVGTKMYRTDGERSELVTDIEMCGYNNASTVRRIRPLSDGRILMVVDYGLVLVASEKTSFEKKTKELTLAYIGDMVDPDLMARVNSFNTANKNVTVTINRYQRISDLNLALLSGEVDIIAINDKMVIRNYVNQGYLAPIDEVCPDLFQDDKLLSSIVEASRYKGHIFDLPRLFFVEEWSTLIGISLPNDSLTDFARGAVSLGVNMKHSLQSQLISRLGISNLDEWIEWEEGSCHFDDGSFEVVLELSALGAKDTDELSFDETPQLNVSQIMMATPVEMFLDKASDSGGIQKRKCFPLPSNKGLGGMIDSSYYLAVVDKDDLANAQSEFLMSFFGEQEQVTTQDEAIFFSISTKETQAALDELLVFEDGELKKEFFEEILKEINRFVYPMNDVTEVILEESSRYFAGDITAKQAAEYIQNRISIYLAEQG